MKYYSIYMTIFCMIRITRTYDVNDFLTKSKQKVLGAMQMTEEDIERFKRGTKEISNQPPIFDKLIITGIQSDEDEVEFSFGSELGQRSVHNAKLCFYVRPTTKTHVKIYAKDEETREKTLIATKILKRSKKTRKYTIDIDPSIVQRWMNEESVTVSFTTKYEDSTIIVFPSDNDIDAIARPIQLKLQLEKNAPRNRRTIANICPDDSENNECCLSRVTLNFAKLGLPNVIEPTEVDIHLCKGVCKKDESFHELFTKHTRRIFRNPKVHGAACCHAKEYNPQDVRIKFINTTGQEEVLLIHQLDATSCLCS